ncbi:U-box domain-containing protein 11-like [Hordeum vulgare]|nr:U-box domain-containing protein 11-like [Hordeum vulgare]
MSVCNGPPLGHLHTVSLLSSSAADAHLLASTAEGDGLESDGLLPRLRLGSFLPRAAALDSLAESVRSSESDSCSAAAVSAVAAKFGSGNILPATRDKVVSLLAAFASSEDMCRFLEQESGGASAEQARLALEPLTSLTAGRVGDHLGSWRCGRAPRGLCSRHASLAGCGRGRAPEHRRVPGPAPGRERGGRSKAS